MSDSNEKGEFMKEKLQSEKGKKLIKSNPHFPREKLKKSYSSPEAIKELKEKLLTSSQERGSTLMSQVAKKAGYRLDALLQLVKDHKELNETLEDCRFNVGINAYEGIEDRSLSGTFSKYSVTKYVFEVREERDRIKQEEHDRSKELIKARQEAEDSTLAKYITRTVTENGQKVHEIKVNPNIKMPDEE